MNLKQLQKEQMEWGKRNFPDHPANRETAHIPLLGVVEEMGELAHAHIKAETGIRYTPEEAEAKARDAVGDVMIYLAAYCNCMGFDLEKCLDDAWEEVSGRDWEANRNEIMNGCGPGCPACAEPAGPYFHLRKEPELSNTTIEAELDPGPQEVAQ